MSKEEKVILSLANKIEEKFDTAKKDQIKKSRHYQEMGRKIVFQLAGPAYRPF